MPNPAACPPEREAPPGLRATNTRRQRAPKRERNSHNACPPEHSEARRSADQVPKQNRPTAWNQFISAGDSNPDAKCRWECKPSLPPRVSKLTCPRSAAPAASVPRSLLVKREGSTFVSAFQPIPASDEAQGIGSDAENSLRQAERCDQRWRPTRCAGICLPCMCEGRPRLFPSYVLAAGWKPAATLDRRRRVRLRAMTKTVGQNKRATGLTRGALSDRG